jgi:hypothetical protein
VRHHEVQQDEIGLEGPVQLEYRAGVGRPLDVRIARRRQQPLEQANIGRLVVDDEDTGRCDSAAVQ